jgi:hypothetical protein
MKKKGRMKIFITVFLVLAFLLFTNSLNLFVSLHKLTPEGEKLLDLKQIKKDAAYILRDSAKVERVETFLIGSAMSLYFGKNKDALERSLQDTSDKYLLITTEDKKIRWDDIDVHKEGKVIAAHQAVNFLSHFIHREHDPSIKAVFLFYYPRMIDLDASETSIVIVIDEFIKEYEHLTNEGFEGKELETKLVEKLIYFDF